MPQPSKILVINLTRMGDIIQTIPFVRRLRIKHPDAEIHMLVEGCFADVAGLVSGVDKLHTVTLEELLPCLAAGKHSNLAQALATYCKFVASLRSEEFCEVWNLTHTRPSMVLNCLLAGEQGRGVTLDREGLQRVNSPWLTYFFATNLARPWCQFNLVDIYANCVDGVDWTAGRDIHFASVPKGDHPQQDTSPIWIAIHAGASQQAKQWPVESYRAVAQQLTRHDNIGIVLVGSRRDAALARAFDGIPRVRDLIGKTSVPQLAELLSHCRLILSNDSGPMHIAAAVGTRVLDITVGSALASETAPYGEGHLVVEADSDCFPCSPSGTCAAQHCAARISAETISALSEWELGLRPALAPDELGGCCIYRTRFSQADGLLELERLFSRITCLRDEINAAMRPAWLAALEGKGVTSSDASHPLPQDLIATASRAADVSSQIADLAGQIARFAKEPECGLEAVERWGRAVQEQETVLRVLLNRHGLLRSLLAFTEIGRASLSASGLEQQALETVGIYRRLNTLLTSLSAAIDSQDAKQVTHIALN